MKHLILVTCLVAMPVSGALAADGGKTLASTLEVYVFPTDGQQAFTNANICFLTKITSRKPGTKPLSAAILRSVEIESIASRGQISVGNYK